MIPHQAPFASLLVSRRAWHKASQVLPAHTWQQEEENVPEHPQDEDRRQHTDIHFSTIATSAWLCHEASMSL